MKPTLSNTRELGVGDTLQISDFIYMDPVDLTEGRQAEGDFIPVGREHAGQIIEGHEDFSFRRYTVESPIDAICKEWCIDTDMGREALYIALENVALLNRKHKDYSAENITAFGEFGVLVRVNDKICRLKNLLSMGMEPKNESVEDSWLDLANYAIIAQLIRRKIWK